MADAVPNKTPGDVKPADAGIPPAPPDKTPAPSPANDDAKPAPAKDSSAAQTPPALQVPEPPNAEPPKAEPPRPPAPVLTPRAIVAECKDTSDFPRKPEKGFLKYVRLAGFGDVIDAANRRQRKGHHVAQAVFSKIGFGEIYAAAAQPKHKTQAIFKAITKKVTDMVAGRMVSTSFRLIAITFVAGMIGGVSGWGAIGLLALATGASSAIYTYGKGYLGDKLFGPKEARKSVRLLDRDRGIEALKAFGSGTFNGAFGAWLATLPLFQSFMKFIRATVHDSVHEISKPLSEAMPSAVSTMRENITAKFNGVSQRMPKLLPRPPFIRRASPFTLG